MAQGIPVDAYIYRHVGLFIQTFRGDALIMRKLTPCHWSGKVLDQGRVLDPRSSSERGYVARSRPTSETDTKLCDTIWNTPVNNEEASWNCQHWVGDALERCVRAHIISLDQMHAAIDKMTDVLLEAPDTA
ncbi:hypothetical protein VM1G_11826 [Cytospora mali]|uniref:Uncharacterized protein n=1 Tax=Cytospora mali TaxID=578113 RepID=A0A194W8H4_CYTMA|nr:hypothetical protein VM1G_11826 [Valsa mali]